MDKFKKVELYEIEYSDFDALVEEKLGRKYECVADNEWSNYESHDFDIVPSDVSQDPESFFQKYTLPDAEKWIRGEKTTIGASDLLEYMAYKDMIPFAKYLITIFW